MKIAAVELDSSGERTNCSPVTGDENISTVFAVTAFSPPSMYPLILSFPAFVQNSSLNVPLPVVKLKNPCKPEKINGRVK